MGLHDSDYMRERYRSRLKGTTWNDRASRVEADRFIPGNRDFRARGRSRVQRAGAGWPPRWLVFAVGILLGLIAIWYRAEQGWPFLDEPVVAFPASGSVTVNQLLDPQKATSRMKVIAGRANAVVQLFAPDSDVHILSVYIRRGDAVTVPVPPGVFRMRLIEGRTWYGRVHFFGPPTRFETVRALQTFTPERGGGIDLRRSPAGTVRTISEWQSPPPL